jgi:hypothetical protein
MLCPAEPVGRPRARNSLCMVERGGVVRSKLEHGDFFALGENAAHGSAERRVSRGETHWRMGCGSSSPGIDVSRAFFVPNDKRPGQGLEAQKDFARLGRELPLTTPRLCAMEPPGAVSKDTIDKLYALFVAMDRDGTGVVDLDEFYRYFQLERSPFSDRVFSIMGEGRGSRGMVRVRVMRRRR